MEAEADSNQMVSSASVLMTITPVHVRKMDETQQVRRTSTWTFSFNSNLELSSGLMLLDGGDVDLVNPFQQ